MQPVDLLIRNGHVIDPKNNISQVMDLGVQNGKIAFAEKNSPHTGEKEIDATGYYVTPGLIDLHAHIYPFFPADVEAEIAIANVHPDAHMPQSGVTTAVDAGTTGWRDFYSFQEHIINKSKTRVLAFLNIAARGMVELESEQTPTEFHPSIVASVVNTFPETIVGIKSAHYWGFAPFDEEHPPWQSLHAAREAASLCGKPIMVDFKPNLPECSYEMLISKMLQPGDIHTHMYAQQFPIFDQQGQLEPYVKKARERGVIFDLGHGAGSFWFRNAAAALEQGFHPDTLSTDLYMKNVGSPVINLLHIMSKYLAIGMPLDEIIYRTTARPAEVISHPELGHLSVGALADIAILNTITGRYGFADSGNARQSADQRLECIATLREGEFTYNPYGLTLPDWHNAPAAYWKSPGVL